MGAGYPLFPFPFFPFHFSTVLSFKHIRLSPSLLSHDERSFTSKVSDDLSISTYSSTISRTKPPTLHIV